MARLHDDLPTATAAAPRTAGAARLRSLRARHALLLLAGLAAVGALKLAEAVVVPVLFVVFVCLLLSPAVEALARRHVPRVLAATLVVVALVAVVAACLGATWQPAREWLDSAPTTLRQLERKLGPVTRFIAKVESVSNRAGRMVEPAAQANDAPMPVALEPQGFVQSTQEWLITVISMLFLSLFLLAADFGRASASDDPGSAAVWLRPVFERVRTQLGRYFGAVTFSNALLGLATAATMAWLDMPNPLLWGVIAFTFNFVPYAGSATTLVLLVVVALVSFDGAARALAVAGTYLLLTTLEGQVLQPVLVGRRLDISPPIVLLGLWFAGWLWGVAGIVLAMPLLVTIRTALQELSRGDAAGIPATPDSVGTRASAWWRHSAVRYRGRRGAAG